MNRRWDEIHQDSGWKKREWSLLATKYAPHEGNNGSPGMTEANLASCEGREEEDVEQGVQEEAMAPWWSRTNSPIQISQKNNMGVAGASGRTP